MQTKEALLFSSVQIGDPSPFGNYQIYPLFLNGDSHPAYTTLLSPGSKEKIRISEEENARVGRIQISNQAEVPVLIPNGQALIGAKQNRTANRDFLIQAGSSSFIDVSCTEKGRWSFRGFKNFIPSDDLDPLWIKKVKIIEELKGLGKIKAGEFPLNHSLSLQSRIWDNINYHSKSGGVESRTSALRDITLKRDENLRKKRIQIPELKADQEGILVTKRGNVIAMECLRGPENYALYHKAIVRSLTFEDFQMDRIREESHPDLVYEWLDSLNEMTHTTRKAINTGENYLLSGKEEEGEMTFLNGDPIHISVIKLAAA